MADHSLAALFKRLRAHSGLSQEQLAERAGLSHRTIGDIESGIRRRRRVVTLHLLADALGLGPQDRAALLHLAHQEGLRAPRDATAEAALPGAPALIGRDRELAELRERFASSQPALVTVTGPPGVGKTALALRFAAAAAPRYAGGAAFVALDTVHDAGLVLAAIARALGVEERDRAAQLLEGLVDRLRSAPTLLVLDNVEHVLDAGPSIAELLRAAPELAVLATGRSPFNLSSEHEMPLAPLSTADAAELFIERAGAVVNGYAPDAGERRHVERICGTLEGLPLAIELAALRVRSFSAAQLADRIWEMLAHGPRDAPPRHQALDAAIAWSYDLLDERLAASFRRFSIFAGGATVEAAKAVCDMHAPAIDTLVRQNLLVAEGAGSSRRLRMLAPIREFAAARLREAGEDDLAGERHAAYFCELAERLGGRSRATLRGCLETFDAERQNFHDALSRSLAAQAWDTGVRTACALADLWRVRNALGEAADWCERFAAAMDESVPPRLRWLALDGATWFNVVLRRLERAAQYSDAALAIAGALPDPAAWAWSTARRGVLEHNLGNAAEAAARTEAALKAASALDDARLRSFAHNAVAIGLMEAGRLDDAAHHLRLAVRHSQAAGIDTFAAIGLVNLAECNRRIGDLDAAEADLERALELAEALGYPTMIARATSFHVEVALERNDLSRARADLVATFGLLAETQEPAVVLAALEGAALYLTAAARYREAAMLHSFWQLRRGRAQREFPQERTLSEADLARVRAQLEPETFEEYWQLGRTLTFDDVGDLLANVELAAPSAR